MIVVGRTRGLVAGLPIPTNSRIGGPKPLTNLCGYDIVETSKAGGDALELEMAGYIELDVLGSVTVEPLLNELVRRAESAADNAEAVRANPAYSVVSDGDNNYLLALESLNAITIACHQAVVAIEDGHSGVFAADVDYDAPLARIGAAMERTSALYRAGSVEYCNTMADMVIISRVDPPQTAPETP